MDTKDKIKIAESDLARVLSFFPRVDAKASVLLGVDVGMLAVLLLNAPPFRTLDVLTTLVLLVPSLMIGWSLVHLYLNAFPQLDGGDNSLIYFREIAKRTEISYMDDFSKIDEDSYLKDLTSQIWRNSEILKKKFDNLRRAFNIFAITVIPWSIALLIMSALNTTSQNLISK
jgi:hypothetical protein